jgi:hypothetical protein
MKILRSLAVQEAAYNDFTHEAVIHAGVEVNEATGALTQTLDLSALPLGAVIKRSVLSLIFGFADLSDTAFNTTKVTVKTVDGAGADKVVLFNAVECNWRAALVITGDQIFKTETVPAVAGDKLVAIITGLAAKKLADLDEGEVAIYLHFSEPLWLNQASNNPPTLGTQSLGLNMEQRAQLTGKTVEQLREEDQAEAKKGKPGEPGEEVDYEGKTVPELKELAAERGVDVPYDARKDEIIKALKKADKEAVKA